MFALEYIALIDSAPVSELTAQWNGCVHAWWYIDAQPPKQYLSLCCHLHMECSCITTTVNQQANGVVWIRHVPYLTKHRYATHTVLPVLMEECACISKISQQHRCVVRTKSTYSESKLNTNHIHVSKWCVCIPQACVWSVSQIVLPQEGCCQNSCNAQWEPILHQDIVSSQVPNALHE